MMACPMQPLNRQFPGTGNRMIRRNLIHSPKGALVRPNLADPAYFQRYHMLNGIHERLKNISSKIRTLKDDLRKRSFCSNIISQDLEGFESDYAFYLSEVKKISAQYRISKIK